MLVRGVLERFFENLGDFELRESESFDTMESRVFLDFAVFVLFGFLFLMDLLIFLKKEFMMLDKSMSCLGESGVISDMVVSVIF